MSRIPETDDFIVDLRKKEPSQQNNQAEMPVRPSKFQAVKKEAVAKEKQKTFGEQVMEHVEEKEEGQSARFFKNADEPAFSLFDFVRYNNAFLVIIVVGIVAFGGLSMASEDVRDATIGSKQVYAEGVDNTLLLETDFNEFSMDFQIVGISEDDEQFLVSYNYIDLDIEEGAWQLINKEVSRRIKKPLRRDLGLYLAEELGEEARGRIKELKKQEQEQGQTKIVQVTQYSGLIGKVLDLSSTVFTGYEPVKKIQLETPQTNEQAAARAGSGGDNLSNVYNEWVEEHPEQVEELNEPVPEIVDDETIGDETTETDGEVSEESEISTELGEEQEAEVVIEESTVEPAQTSGEVDEEKVTEVEPEPEPELIPNETPVEPVETPTEPTE